MLLLRGHDRLDRALAELEQRAPLQANCVRLRYLAELDFTESAEREILSVSWLRLGKDRWSRVGGGPQASGLANKPGSGSMRMPQLTRRFSLEQMPSVFFGGIGRWRAWQRSRARIGRPASARAVRICW